jgi:hypothetical protein
MKLKTNKSKNKIIIVFVGVAIIGLGIGAFALHQASQNDEPLPSESQQTREIPQDELEEYNKEQKQEAINEDQPSDIPPNAPLSVAFTSISQMDSTVRVRAEIDTLVSNGICTLTMTKSSDTITKTAATYPTANSSTCQGFDVPTAELSPGTWNINLTVTKDGQSGQATSQVDVS